MAILKTPQEEEEKKVDEGTGAIVGGGTTTLEGTGGGEDVSTDIGAGQDPVAPVGGQNVSEQEAYLDANRQKALDLAGKAGDVIRGDITKAGTGMTEAERRYKEDVAASTVNMDQDFYGKATGALVDQTAPGWTQQGLDDFMAGQYQEATAAQEYNDWAQSQGYNTADPTEASKYQEDYDAYLNEFTPQEALTNQQFFQNQYNAEYGGPKDIYSQDYWGDTQRAYEKAQQTRELMKTLEGRQNLVARTYGEGSGRYSRGTTALDESLLSGYDETMAELAAAGDAGLGLEAQLEGLGTMSEKEYLDALETTGKTKSAYGEQFDLTGEEQEIRDKTASIKNQAKKDYEDYLKYVSDTYGVKEDLYATNYFDNQQDYGNIQAQNVMSNEDVSRMKALESLTNSVGTLTPFEAQAGGYKDYIDPSANFRKEDFEKDTGAREKIRLDKIEADRKRQEAQAAEVAEAQRLQEEADKKAQATAIGAAVGATAGAIVGSIVPGIGTAAGAVVGGALGSVVGSLFCFDGSSEFEMADGTYKMIKDIEIGDVLKEGGKVYSVSKHVLSSHLYSYPTGDEDSYVWVTGNHAVKEDGKWTRVSKSRKSSLVYDHDIEFTYSLSCENHVMISHGITFADYEEVENSQGLTDHQCLNVLNQGEMLNVC